MAEAPNMVYSRLLTPKGNGYPMYVPEPPDVVNEDDIRKKYHERGIDIGDVGVLDGGSFNFIFSICHSAVDPINFNGLPPGYIPERLKIEDIDRRDGFHPPRYIKTDSMTKSDFEMESDVMIVTPQSPPFASVGAGIHFESSGAEGAVLVLPEGASRADLTALAKVRFMHKVDTNAFRWRDFANGGSNNQSLYLITGVDKTTSWGIASYSNASSDRRMSLRFKAASVISGNVRCAYQWEVNGGADVRVGPKCSASDTAQIEEQRRLMTNLNQITGQGQSGSLGEQGSSQNQTQRGDRRPQNQCIFIRGYMLSFRDDLVPLRKPLKISGISKGDAESYTRGSRTESLFKRLGWYNSGPESGQNTSARQSVDGTTDEASVEPVVVIEDIPGASKPYHPSIIINNFLLDKVPNAQVAATHDDEWISVTLGKEGSVLTETELCSLIDREYDAVISPDGWLASWKKKSAIVNHQPVDSRDKKRRRMFHGNVLQAAAAEGSIMAVQQLLDEGQDINVQGGVYGNALHAASAGGHTEVVQILLDKGADVNALGGEYGSALQAAFKRGHPSIVQMLLHKGANGANAEDALHVASMEGQTKMVQVLLENGADVNARRGEYSNALQAASTGGHSSIVQMLLEKGADVNARGGKYGSALQAASVGGHTSIVQILLEKGADVDACGGKYGNALQAAATSGHISTVQMLLNKGTDVNAQGGPNGNSLSAALLNGHTPIVRILLDHGAYVNVLKEQEQSALHVASLCGHGSIVQVLLNNGTDVDGSGGNLGNALQAASLGGHDLIVRMLLAHGANVNAYGGYFGNALQAASLRGHSSIVQTLLNSGADINADGNFGNALQAASLGGHTMIVQMLLDDGANVNMYEAETGHVLQVEPQWYYIRDMEEPTQILNLIEQMLGDILVHKLTYSNALQAASARGHTAVVRMLLENGADAKKYDNALQVAYTRGHTSIVHMLLDKEADANVLEGNVSCSDNTP